MQPDVRENAPEGACGSFGVAPARQSCHAAAAESTQPEQHDAQKEWKLQSLWRRLIRDKRISHGAFRLWHHYRDIMDKDSTVSGYLSLTPTTAGYLGSNNQCIGRWNDELKANAWLKWDTAGERKPRVYRILNGLGTVVRKAAYREPQIELPLPYTAAPRVAGSGNTVLPFRAAGVAGSGNTGSTKSKEYGVNGHPLQRERWMIEKDRQAIHSAWMEALTAPPSLERREILKGLRMQRNQLLREMAGFNGIDPATSVAAAAGDQETGTGSEDRQLAQQVLSPMPDALGPKPGDSGYEEWKKAL